MSWNIFFPSLFEHDDFVGLRMCSVTANSSEAAGVLERAQLYPFLSSCFIPS